MKMNEGEGEFILRRILVALDGSKHSLAALDAAVHLAAGLEAELHGIFVEDINLLKLAHLPFARHIRYPSAATEPIDAAGLERELRVKGEQARKALAAAASPAQVPWSFRVLRGRVTAEVLAAASGADLLTMGKGGHSLTGRRLGSIALAAVANAPRALMFVQEGVRFGPPILAVYDASPGSLRALGAAQRFAEAMGDGMTLIIVAEGHEAARRAREELAPLVERGKRQVHYRYVASASDLVAAVLRERGGVLVLSGSQVGKQDVLRLLHEVKIPVVLLGS